MTNLEAFALGIMVMLTPSLVALAILMRRAPTWEDEFTQARSRSPLAKVER
jgi:hypothetical protein